MQKLRKRGEDKDEDEDEEKNTRHEDTLTICDK